MKQRQRYIFIVLWGWVLAVVVLFARSTASPAFAQVFIPPPVFDTPHGIYTTTIQVTLSDPLPDTLIRYTTDLSAPTPLYGSLYRGPFPITQTTIIRAIAFVGTANKSAIAAQSYIFLNRVLQQPANPGGTWPPTFAKQDSSGGPYPADYEMDPEVVNYPDYAGKFDPVFKSIPTISLVTDQANLWNNKTGIYVNPNQKGAAWERPVSIEWFDSTGASIGFSEAAGMRLNGQESRRPVRQPKKSFRLYFSAQYGKTKLDFKLFDDNEAVSKFDRLLLRGGSNRSWSYFERFSRANADYINDEFARRAYLEMGWLTPHGTYAHLYLNGLYWGIYNVTERVDERFLSSYMGDSELDYDLLTPDEDMGNIPVADAGTLDAWNQLQSLLTVPTVDAALYEQVKQKLDVVNLTDYMILLHYIANTDWPVHNWYAWRKRIGPDTRFRMVVWDSDTAMRSLNDNTTKSNLPNTPASIYHTLLTNPEFRQLVVDRVYKLFVNEQGALTSNGCVTRYTKLTNTIDQPIIAESARWGDYMRDLYPAATLTSSLSITSILPAYLYSRDLPNGYTDPQNTVPDVDQKTWLQVVNQKLGSYCLDRTKVVLGQYVANGWYTTTLEAPLFSQEGGAVNANYTLVIANPPLNGAGDVYYTLDGSDPRATGGGVAATAQTGVNPLNVSITRVTQVKTRILNNGTWSPLHEAIFYPTQPLSNLVINEIHYHPVAPAGVDGDLYEFAELYNAGTVPLRLDNVHFSRGFSYHFPLNTTINAGSYLVLAANAPQFQARYGFAPFATYIGNLSNGGEGIEVSDALGAVIDGVDFADQTPWPMPPDGSGPSLSLCNPKSDNSQPSNWAASNASNGTPGQANGLTCGTVNSAPSVSILTPLDDATILVGKTITLTASASDSDGTVTQVQFFANGAPLKDCVDNAAPYECSFTPVVGIYVLSAVATDNANAATTSVPIHISVASPSNQLPTVQIVSPSTGATVPGNQPVIIQANATDPDGPIQDVTFYANDIPVCKDIISPFECTWTPSTAGDVNLYATATDNQGGKDISPNLIVHVIDSIPVDAFIAENGKLVIEAEHFYNKTLRSDHEWQEQENLPAASDSASGSLMIALPNNATYIKTDIVNSSPALQYPVLVTTSGSHQLWLRVRVDGKEDNTLYIGLDDAVSTQINAPFGTGWNWVRRAITIPMPGIHSLSLWMGEDNFRVDRLIVTVDDTFKPTGVGPVESRRQQAFLASNFPASTANPGNAAQPLDVTLTISSVVEGVPPIFLSAQVNNSSSTESTVRFFVNGTALPECDNASTPYQCTWTPAAGIYSLRAIAYSDDSEVKSGEQHIIVSSQPGGGVLSQRLYFPVIQR